MFDAEKVKNDIVKWIREWFENNGPGCNGVVAVSGGKDSSVVAALLVEALGKDRVIGVMLPRGVQPDIDMSYLLVKRLGIKSYEINVGETIDALEREMKNVMGEDAVSTQAIVNLPPRVRMAATYAVSQSVNGRVANTCNLSEDWVGYATRYGDNAGDFSPLSRLTVQEVKAVGRVLGLPDVLVDKVPSDGLQAKTDEDNLGFTYAVLDRYIREGVCDDPVATERIDKKLTMNLFKMRTMPKFEYEVEQWRSLWQ